MIFVSVGLTGGCSTGLSFEVGRTTLLSPPGDRKAFGRRGAHVLQAGSTCGSAVLQYKPCLRATAFPVPPTYPSPSGEELPWQSLPSAFFWVIVAVETVHPHSFLSCRFPWVRLRSRTCKNVYFYIQGFKKKKVWLSKKVRLKQYEIQNHS